MVCNYSQECFLIASQFFLVSSRLKTSKTMSNSSMSHFEQKTASSTAPSHKRGISDTASAAIKATATLNISTATTESLKPFRKPSFPEFQKSLKNCYKEDDKPVSNSHLGTQLHIIIDFLKLQEKPITLSYLKTRFTKDVMATLMPVLLKVDRLKYHSDEQIFVYDAFKTTSELKKYLHSQPTFKGTPIRYLQDGWSDCLKAIDELEIASEILVKRSSSDNAPVLVWLNKGGPIANSNEDSVRIWDNIKLPMGDDLVFKLAEEGLKATSVDSSKLPKATSSCTILDSIVATPTLQQTELQESTHLYPPVLQQPTSITQSGRKKPKRAKTSICQVSAQH